MRKFVFSLVIIMMVSMAGFAAVIIYAMIGQGSSPAMPSAQVASAGFQNEDMFADEAQAVEVWNPANPAPSPTPTNTANRITWDTLMIYEHHIAGTDHFETVEEYPSQFLLNMSRAELAAIFTDWQIMSFSAHEVRLRQNIAVTERQYTISVFNGFIAVFYNDENGEIKELTNRPISALPIEEQERLINGITVIGNDELLRALEDFGS